MSDHGFFWLLLLPGTKYELLHIYGAMLACVLLIFGGLKFRKHMIKRDLIPSRKFSLATPFELICDMLYGVQKSIIGDHSEKYLPLTGTVFFFILTCNLIGMIPGFTAPTSNFFTNLAIAAVVVLATHIYGVKVHGPTNYGKHFMAPLAGIGGLVLSLLFTPIEIVSHGFRLVSLPLRLWGNISADHTVLHIMESLIPWILPIPFLFLGLLVSVVQAFIFSLLAMIYIALATADAH